MKKGARFVVTVLAVLAAISVASFAEVSLQSVADGVQTRSGMKVSVGFGKLVYIQATTAEACPEGTPDPCG